MVNFGSYGGVLDNTVYGWISSAIRNNNKEKLQEHIGYYKDPELEGKVKEHLDAVDGDGKSLLDLAFESGDKDIINMILTFPGIDLEAKNSTQRSGMEYIESLQDQKEIQELFAIAMSNLNFEVVKLLQDKVKVNEEVVKSLINTFYEYDMPEILKEEEVDEWVKVVDILVGKIPSNVISCQGEEGNSLLHAAIDSGEDNLVEKVADSGIDLELLNEKGRSALKLAVMNDFENAQKLLVKKGLKMDFTVGIDEKESGAWGMLGYTKEKRVSILEDALDEERYELVFEILKNDRYNHFTAEEIKKIIDSKIISGRRSEYSTRVQKLIEYTIKKGNLGGGDKEFISKFMSKFISLALVDLGANINEIAKATTEASDENFKLIIEQISNNNELLEEIFKDLVEKNQISKIIIMVDSIPAESKEKYPINFIDLCKANKTKVVSALLEKKWGDINAKDENGDTLLSLAMRNSNINLCKKLINDSRIDLHSVNEDGLTPFAQLCLSEADAEKSLELKNLLYSSPNFDAQKEKEAKKMLGFSYVEMAYRSRNYDLALSLVDDTQDNMRLFSNSELIDNAKNLFFIAAECNNERDPELLSALAKKKYFPVKEAIRINIGTESDQIIADASLLALMCDGGNVEAVEALLAHEELDINNGFEGVKEGDPVLSPILITLDNLDNELKKGDSADRLLISKYAKIIEKLALDERLDLTEEVYPGTPIIHAICSYPQINKELVIKNRVGGANADVEVEIKNERGDSLLMTAAQVGDLKLVEELGEKGADIFAKNRYNQGAMMLAASCGRNRDEDVKKTLLRLNILSRLAGKNSAADSEKLEKDKYGNNALHYAVASGDVERARILHKEFKKTVIDKSFVPAAYSICNPEMIKFVRENIEKDFDANYVDPIHGSALHCLVSSEEDNSLEILKKLIEGDAYVDANSKNELGVTPLMIAVQKGDLEKMKVIMSQPETDVNLADNAGNTALMIACKEGDRRIIEELLRNSRIGKSINDKNKDGMNALLISFYGQEREEREKGRTIDEYICRRLIEHGADPNFGRKYQSFRYRVGKVIAKVSLYSLISRLTSYFFPPAQYASELVRDGLYAHVIGKEMGKFASEKIHNFFGSGIINTDNLCFIGNFNINSVGMTYYGSDLKSAVKNNVAYKNNKEFDNAIFTCDDLEKRIREGKIDDVQRYRMHIELISKYNVVNSALNKSWALWRDGTLKIIEKEILRADDLLLNIPRNIPGKESSWRTSFYKLLKQDANIAKFCKFIEENSAKKVASSILRDEDKGQEIKKILDDIVSGKIVVGIKLHSAAQEVLSEYGKEKKSSKNITTEKLIDLDIDDIRRKFEMCSEKIDEVALRANQQIENKIKDQNGRELSSKNNIKDMANLGGKITEAVTTAAVLISKREDLRSAAMFSVAAGFSALTVSAIAAAAMFGGIGYGVYKIATRRTNQSNNVSTKLEKFMKKNKVTEFSDIDEADIEDEIDVDFIPDDRLNKEKEGFTEKTNTYESFTDRVENDKGSKNQQQGVVK